MTLQELLMHFIGQEPSPPQQNTSDPLNQVPTQMGYWAESRFTHNDIFSNPKEINRGASYPGDVTGQTVLSSATNTQPVIGINPSSKSNLSDINSAIAHEDIHSLLGKLIGQWTTPETSNNKDMEFLFNRSQRAGNTQKELPAYMGAFRQGEIPYVHSEDADKWNEQFLAGLPPEAARTLRRIISSAKASQK